MNIRNGVLLWFRNDLRLNDNPALSAASRHGGPIIPVFIWAPEEEHPWQPGGASCWWLHQSLTRLDASLRRRGSRLIIRRGPTTNTLCELVKKTGANAVYWNRRYEPAAIFRDRETQRTLTKKGVVAESYKGSLLYEPGTIQNQQGLPFKVFTPFWRACLARAPSGDPESAPDRLPGPRQWPPTLPIGELGLEPTLNWATGIRASWNPGENGAIELLEDFMRSGLAGYATERDRPDRAGTSLLSPHLHFGEISPRQILAAIKKIREFKGNASNAEDAAFFARELGWREFAHHLLFHFPETPRAPLRKEFATMPWRTDPKALRAWQRGRTGYPIVDAGMRELWHTGWMHNRVRMITASFLVKDLLISWQKGAEWFWDTLVDADLANNTLGWQWTAGCGADAAPFFRVFNPVSQGEKFDPNGDYVRRWVPELANVPTRWIHRPWDAPASELGEANILLEKTYPRPLVDHAEAHRRALEAFRQMREKVALRKER